MRSVGRPRLKWSLKSKNNRSCEGVSILRSAVVACLLLLSALPALAEDDVATIQNSMGYANLSFPSLTTGQPSRHSGFANETDFNLTRRFGLDNYLGIY